MAVQRDLGVGDHGHDLAHGGDDADVAAQLAGEAAGGGCELGGAVGLAVRAGKVERPRVARVARAAAHGVYIPIGHGVTSGT